MNLSRQTHTTMCDAGHKGILIELSESDEKSDVVSQLQVIKKDDKLNISVGRAEYLASGETVSDEFELISINESEARQVANYLNENYPPNLKSLIPDLKWTRSPIELYSENHLAIVTISLKTLEVDITNVFGWMHSSRNEAIRFNLLEDSIIWANEQYKNKVMEVLGL